MCICVYRCLVVGVHPDVHASVRVGVRACARVCACTCACARVHMHPMIFVPARPAISCWPFVSARDFAFHSVGKTWRSNY